MHSDDALRAQEQVRMTSFLTDMAAFRGDQQALRADWEPILPREPDPDQPDPDQLELDFTYPRGVTKLYGAPLVGDLVEPARPAAAGDERLGLVVVPVMTIAVVLGAIVAALL